MFFYWRLYCHAINTISRRSAVFVLNEMLKHTTLILAPLLPHLTEEVYLYHPQRGERCLFNLISLHCHPNIHTFQVRKDFFVTVSCPLCPYSVVRKLLSGWNLHLPCAKQSTSSWEPVARKSGTSISSPIHKTTTFFRFHSINFRLMFQKWTYIFFQKFQTEETSFDSDLCEILQVSGVTLHSAESCSTANDAADIKKFQIHQSGPIDVKLSQSQLKACLRCRRFTSVDGSLCPSCVRMTS